MSNQGKKIRRFTDDQLLAIARQFNTRCEWRYTDYSSHICAHRRGKEFYERCTEHMSAAPLGPKRKEVNRGN